MSGFDLNTLIKQFRWFFDIRGVETHELTNAPTGWHDLIAEYTRSKTYMGILRNITGQLEFTGKAAYYLRREYAKYRLLARMILRIEEDTRQPYNTYTNIYTGQLDFSKKIDRQNTFTVGAKSADFSQQVDAYDGQQFSISLDDGINLELPGLSLDEIATLVPGAPDDGNIHSDYFPPLSLTNNTQNSIDQTTYEVKYDQFRNPDFSTRGSFFFVCRLTGKLHITGVITFRVDSNGLPAQQVLAIFNQNGDIVLNIFDAVISVGSNQVYTFNSAIDVTKGDRLFLYTAISVELSNSGITIKSGEINLAYQTITPPTMCQALSGTQLFGKLLQAMNINQDAGPNLPVAFQSVLLSGALGQLHFTSSDSIRNAQGSTFIAGNTIGPGVYKVISIEPIVYAGITYNIYQTFGFDSINTTFTGAGVVQKIQSITRGNVFNIGDSLQAGGTYLVQGITLDGTVTYNAHAYAIGEFFKFVLGFDTFSGSDDTMFVKEVALDPQIITSFADFFQCIKSIQGGDCSFGAVPIPFLEALDNVFRSGLTPVTDLGNVPKDWQSACATDMMYNTIDVGQKDQQYDAINGTQEVMSVQSYASALLDPAVKLNLVDAYRRDSYGIESVRITQADTAASRSDNDTWAIWVKTDPESIAPFVYYRPVGSEALMQPIVGVDPSYYNWMLSPKRCLLRGSRYLASIFYDMAGYQLRLTGYKKNIGLVTVGLDGVRVSEADPVEIANLGAPYFIPEYYSMTIPGGLIDANSYGEIAFTVNGNKMRGFVAAYKTNFSTKKPQTVKLLLSPLNNLLLSVR